MINEVLVALNWLLFSATAIPLAVFIFETAFGFARSLSCPLSGETPTTIVLIPAHNEEAIIGETLQRLSQALPDRTSILVVADNCSDRTAAIVRELGFAVLERQDSERRGKGYALAHGRDHLRASPPDCVIVFDADCQSDKQSFSDLARYCCLYMRPTQARYTFEANRDASPKVQISNFAFWLKNVVRQRGAKRLGGPAILTGTGMAFPWPVFEQTALATGNIVEDLALCVDLTRSGCGPVFLEQALVTSEAASEGATLEQRARWEHGFLSTTGQHGLPTIWHGLLSMNWQAVWLGLHLLVPPLALFVFVSMACLGLLVGTGMITSDWHPAIFLSVLLITAFGFILANWVVEGRAWLRPGALFMLPLYLIWKTPLYLRFLAGRKSGWTRTER